MPNDITTLAIEIQSQEAERNLRTFNELLSLSSTTAQKMEKVSIAVDVTQAVAQLRALRESYAEVASAAGSMSLDIPAIPSPDINASALEELKAFFAQSLEASRGLREEMANFNSELEKLESGNIKVATSYGGAESGARMAAAANSEYARVFREVIAAQKEADKTAAQADAAMKATVAADEDAAAVKKRLTQAQRELASVSKQLAATHSGMGGDIIGLSEKEDHLKNKVAELKSVYAEAKAAADKFNQKLEESADKADAARAKYQQLKAQLEAMPKPMAQMTSGANDFSKTARGAAMRATKMARGFNAVAFAAGASIPGLNKIGQVIGTFAYAGPVIGSIVVGVGALAAGIKFLYDESQKGYKIAHEHAVQAQKDVQSTKESIASLAKEWDRLAEFESAGTLTNEQNAEAARIIEHLTDVYGDLGLEIDKNTRKLKGYSAARAEASEREREDAIKAAKRAVKKAKSDVDKQTEKYTKNASARDFFASLEGKSPEEILRALKDRKDELEDIQDNEKKYRLSTGNGKHVEADYEQSWWKRALTIFGASQTMQHNPTEENIQAFEKAALTNASVDKELELLGNGEKDGKGLISAYKRLAEAKKNAAEVDVKPKAALNAKREALLKQGLMIGDDGSARLLTSAEQYARQKEEISRIEKNIAEVGEKYGKNNAEYLRLEAQRDKLLQSTLQYEAKISQEKQRQSERTKRETEALKARLEAIRDTYVLDSKGNAVRKRDSAEQAATRSKKIQELRGKIDTLLQTTPALRRNATGEDLLAWGKRFNPATGKMDGAQKQAGWRGILPDGNGGVMTEVSVGTQINGKEVQIPLIVPESTEADLKRIAQIANGELTDIPDDLMEKAVSFAQKRIAAGKSPFFNGDSSDEHLRKVTTGDSVLRDLVKYQSQMSGLQGEQLRFNDASKRAREQVERGRRGFVYDKKGNIVREKTDAEPAKVRQQEIAAAREKVKQYSKGSVERYQAQAELDRLVQEDFKKRQETSFANLGFSQMQAHNNMVQGVEAKSSQALRLETRNFSKPDNAWKTLEKIQTQVRDAVSGFAPDITSIAEGSRNMSEKLVPL